MTHYFLDSSALIKRYVDETGSVWIRRLLDDSSGNRILIAEIAPVEVYSGATRHMREGQVDLVGVQELRLVLQAHVDLQYLLVVLTSETISQAQDLLERYPLRAYDAVQLASAYTTNRRLLANDLAPLVFVSADRRLNQAAAAEGLLTDDPSAHP